MERFPTPNHHNKADEICIYRFAMSLMINFKHHKLQAKNILMICYDNNEISWYRPLVNTGSNISSCFLKFQLGSREITKSLNLEKIHLKRWEMSSKLFWLKSEKWWLFTIFWNFLNILDFLDFFKILKDISHLFSNFSTGKMFEMFEKCSEINCKACE